jgi:hypothetical protein
MITDPKSELTVFLKTVSVAVWQLKQQLQHDYERAYPQLRDIIHLVVDEEAARAWSLSLFPHLLLPDLVEAHIEKLNLEPAHTAHSIVAVPRRFSAASNYQPAFGLCA